MTRRYRATKLRTTLQRPIGEPKPEKREQLDLLRDHLVASGLTELRQAWMHPIYRQAMAYGYEDLSPYFRMVDEEVRQIALARVQKAEEAAESLQSLKRPCAGCGYAWPYGEWCDQSCYGRAKRREKVGAAFAELGRIVGEHAGDIRLSVEYPDPEEVRRDLAKAGTYRFATLTETAPAKVKEDSACSFSMCGVRVDEGPGRWSVWCCDEHFGKRGGW